MGFSFELEHANLVAYLTSPALRRAPQVTAWELRSFLWPMAEPTPDLGFISTDKRWLEDIQRVATARVQALERRGHDTDQLLGPEEVEEALVPLRAALGRFHLFALTLDDRRAEAASTELAAVARHLAFSASHQTLILMPAWYRDSNVNVLDPLPQFALALENPASWPGMLFWTATGATAVAPLSDCAALVGDLVPRTADGDLEGVDRVLSRYRPRGKGKRLLHLSDLHFGSPSATQNEALLEGELHTVASTADRVVITGDLFDSPTLGAAQAFRNFRLALRRVCASEPLVVPGNHDQRMWGNVGQDFRQVANLNWCNFVADPELKCVFLGFNSSESGRFARGRIGQEQLVRVASEYQNAMAVQPELRTYLPMVLVHHHPFSFHTASETWVQRLLGAFGVDDERFLEMEDARDFVQWCARWNVAAILHGHKHVPRHVVEYVTTADGSANVTAIGCGSSLGAEGSPVAYNVLSLDERCGRWAVSFFASTGGGPFVRKKVAVRQASDRG